jgi:hypothetical protein
MQRKTDGSEVKLLTDADRMQIDRFDEMREKSALNAQEVPTEYLIRAGHVSNVFAIVNGVKRQNGTSRFGRNRSFT